MRTTLKTRRLLLDESAGRCVESMMATLRTEGGSHVRLSPSKIGSWALNCFFEKYFGKEIRHMVEALTDKRATLISIIQEMPEGSNLDAMLRLLKQREVGHNVTTKPTEENK